MQERFSVFVRVTVMVVYICTNSLNCILNIRALSDYYCVYVVPQFEKVKKKKEKERKNKKGNESIGRVRN